MSFSTYDHIDNILLVEINEIVNNCLAVFTSNLPKYHLPWLSNNFDQIVQEAWQYFSYIDVQLWKNFSAETDDL